MKNLLSFVLVLFVFAACNKESKIDLDTDNIVAKMANETVTTYSKDGERKEFDCFKINFPVDLNFPDGTTSTFADMESMRISIKTWFTDNSESKEKPTFVYPIELIFKDDETKAITSDKDMFEVFKYCKGEFKGNKKCFELQFPATFILEDASTLIANDWDELKNALSDDEKFELQFPADVVFDDGTVKTISNETEMTNLKKDCYDKVDNDKCFKLDFPFTIILEDGSTEIVNDWDDVKNTIDDKEEFQLQFPVNVAMENESIVTVNNETEMSDLKKDCE